MRIFVLASILSMALAAGAQEIPEPSPSVAVLSAETQIQAPIFQIYPANLVQGQSALMQMQIAVSAPQTSFRVDVAGQSIALFEDGLSEDGQMRKYKAFLAIKGDLKPGGYTLRVKNGEGQILFQDKLEIRPGSFYTQHIRFVTPPLTPEVAALVAKEDKLVDEARLSRSEKALWEGSFMLPVPHRMSAAYGTRRYLNGKYNGYHSGVDFASPQGYPVKAIANAQVSLARYFSKYNSNGNLIFLDHGQGVTSVYIHLSKLAVKEGDLVKKGQTIGYIGTTGRSTGPHLHWGVYLNGYNTDGLNWIRFSERAFR
jgi:murein DD-endopeptidase MepM/ murein hydrolase activator NlpD